MTAPLSLLPLPAPQRAAVANTPAPEPGRSADAAPFSRMLDRAVHDHPECKSKPSQSEGAAAKSTKPGTEAKADRAERKLESESRPARGKNQQREREVAESLTSACSVVAPATPPPEAPPVPEGEVIGEVFRVAAGSGASVAEVDFAGKAEASATDSDPVAAVDETANANTGLDLTSLLPTTEPDGSEAGVSIAAPSPPIAPDVAAAVLSDRSLEGTDSLVTPTANASEVMMPAPKAITPVKMPVDQTQVATAETPAPVMATNPSSPAHLPAALVMQSVGGAAAPETSAPADGARVNAPALAASGANEVVAAAPEAVRRSVRAVRRARLEVLENAAGTGGAKGSETMKTAIKKEELAGGAEQFLPVSSPNALSALRNLPGEQDRRLTGPKATALESAEGVVAYPAPGGVASDTDALFVRSANPMTRISEIVSREIRMFKRGGDDLVEVVLTPDAKTQISLRLQWRDGQVEVQARCDLGDYQSLNTQWPQLQASLADHGVRLSHLSERVSTGFTEFFNNPSFAQQRGREEQPRPGANPPEAVPSLTAPATPKSGGAAVVRRSNRLFDSWA